jgi:2-dehydro-3-deoxyphosphogluconate aldolase/(4S)-4-hydroxy-2-oxoglutarate aldolase
MPGTVAHSQLVLGQAQYSGFKRISVLKKVNAGVLGQSVFRYVFLTAACYTVPMIRMNTTFEQIGKTGVVPVIKIDDPEKALPLARALLAGNLPCAEITFRSGAAEEAIRRIHGEVPEILLGAGTILTTDQADRAAAAGARFAVSPGFNPRVVSHCIEMGLPIIPGCSNPSDMEKALEAGLETVKFFPAEQSGGLDYIKAVAAPYPMLRFMPTGGINPQNLVKYLAFKKVPACGGSWMAGADLINAGDFTRITALCKEAVELAAKAKAKAK